MRDEPWEVWVAIDTNQGGAAVQQASHKAVIMSWHCYTRWSMQFLWALQIHHVHLYHAGGMTAHLGK